MLKFSFTLPIILSSLYISFSQAQYSLPSCALSCAQRAGYQAGCNPNDLTCVCSNDAFIRAACSCVWQSCSNSDAQTAVDYWDSLCGGCNCGPSSGTGIISTVTPSSYVPPSGSSVSSSSGTRSSSRGYGYPTASSSTTTSASVTSSNPYPYGVSSSATSTSVARSNPYGYGGSSSGSASRGYGSSPSTSNLAATMPTHAAALVAGGIGAMVAVFM